MLFQTMASNQENIAANILSDPSDKMTQEVSDLKLQLNASQQTIANLHMKIIQKDEIVIKTQADTLKETQAYKLELQRMKEQLWETSQKVDNTPASELQEALKLAQEKEAKALSDLQERMAKDVKMNQMLEEYEKTIQNHVFEYKRLNEQHETVKGNLATLEMAFHDVIQKYERSKTVIEGYKANEQIFNKNTEAMDKNLKMEIQRYESLKAHARTQIEKANKENVAIRQQYEMQELKQNTIIKRLEIKVASLELSLEQKNRECSELAALCDEVTGKKV